MGHHGCVINVVNIRSKREEIESNMDTGGVKIESSVETEGDRTGYNMETKENVTKMSLQRGDEGKRKIIPQVVRVNSPCWDSS